MPKPRSYTDEELYEAVTESYSVMEVLDRLGIKKAGGSHAHMSRRIKALELDTTHFKRSAHNKGVASPKRLSANLLLVKKPEGSPKTKTFQLRRALFDIGRNEICESCGIGTEWNGRSLRLEIDHIDGDWLNNLSDNLQFLCPNCHCQKTYNAPVIQRER